MHGGALAELHEKSTTAESAPAVNGVSEKLWLEAPAPRRIEVENRQRAIGEWLVRNSFDALLLFDPENMAWFTAGGRFSGGAQALAESTCLYITVQHRCVISNNHHAARLFAEEVAGLGFYLKEISWTLPVSRMVNELCAERRVVADRLHPAVTARRIELMHLRRSLTPFDADRFRGLTSEIAGIVETTCRTFDRNATEADIAAQVSHRLLRAGLEPIAVHLFADGRAVRYPRPLPSNLPIKEHLCLAVAARRGGLAALTARTVSFGTPSEALRSRHRAASIAAASLLHYAKAGEAVARTLPLAKVSFKAAGLEFAWCDAPIGGFAGYNAQLDPFLPDSTELFAAGDAIAVMPFVEGCMSADSALVGKDAVEILSFVDSWPILGIQLGDVDIERPDILIRTS